MSISSEISRIKSNVTSAYSALSEKGATMPSVLNTANLKSTIESIEMMTAEAMSVDTIRSICYVPSDFEKNYTAVEYIESTGTQYIDTGFRATSTNIRVVCDWEYTKAPSDDSIFGSESSGYSIVPYAYQSTVLAYYVGKSAALNRSTVAANTRYVLDVTANTGTLTTNLNGSVLSSSYTQPFDSANSIFVFANNKSGSAIQKTSAKLYSMQIYDNGVLVRDFVPCKSKKNGTHGLYDMVNKNFHGNYGTGIFIAPVELVELPGGYTAMNYLQSSGTQYIDTGFKPNQDSKMDIDAQHVSTSGTVSIGGVRTDGANNFFGWIGVSGNLRSYYYNTYQVVSTLDTSRHTYTKDKNQTLIDNALLSTLTYGNFSNTQSILLFACNDKNGADFYSSVRMYSCQIYDSGMLVRYFVPCKNESGVFGMYDRVNAKFYENAGSGSFTGA